MLPLVNTDSSLEVAPTGLTLGARRVASLLKEVTLVLFAYDTAAPSSLDSISPSALSACTRAFPAFSSFKIVSRAGPACVNFSLLAARIASALTSPSLLSKIESILSVSAAEARELSLVAIGLHKPLMRSRPEGFFHAASRFNASLRASSEWFLSAAIIARGSALARR